LRKEATSPNSFGMVPSKLLSAKDLKIERIKLTLDEEGKRRKGADKISKGMVRDRTVIFPERRLLARLLTKEKDERKGISNKAQDERIGYIDFKLGEKP